MTLVFWSNFSQLSWETWAFFYPGQERFTLEGADIKYLLFP